MLHRHSLARLREIDAKRICVIKPSAFGDVVQSLPLLPALRERFPAAEISWVINRELSDLVSSHPQLTHTIPFDRRGSWSHWGGLLRELRRQRYDLVFDLQGLLRTGIMAAATGARHRVGLETAREGSHLACRYIVPETGRDVPAHARYWRVAESLGLAATPARTILPVPQQELNWANQEFSRLGRPVMAVHPGARWVTKRWPVEKFAVVAGKAIRQYGFSIVIVGGPAERTVGMQLEQLLQRLAPARSVLNFTGRTTLKQLGALLSSADLLLTNDSGPMHLAAGLGTPVLGVFTCTSPELSGPPGAHHELIATQVKCAASYKKRCPCRGRRHMACMDELATERVSQAFARLVDKNRIGSRAA